MTRGPRIADALGDLRRALFAAGANDPVRLVVSKRVARAFVREARRHGVRGSVEREWPERLVARIHGVEIWIKEDE